MGSSKLTLPRLMPTRSAARVLIVRRPDADRAGIVGSTLCAVHCVAGAVLAGASGVAPMLADRRLELGFAAAAVAFASIAFVRGFRRHACRTPALVGAFGIASLVVACFGGIHPALVETALSIAAAVLLVTAHVLNIRRLRAIDTCCAAEADRAGAVTVGDGSGADASN